MDFNDRQGRNCPSLLQSKKGILIPNSVSRTLKKLMFIENKNKKNKSDYLLILFLLN